MGKNEKPRIKSISLNSEIVACLNNTPVPTPIWEAAESKKDDTKVTGENDIHLFNGEGSSRPGVMVIDNKRHRGLTVTITVDNINNYQSPSLHGQLSFAKEDREILEAPEDMLTHTKFKAVLQDKTSDTLIFSVFPDPVPRQFYRLYGLMSWTLSYNSNEPGNTQMNVELEDTYLEIFWIHGVPGKMYKKGVWVELLRLLNLECVGLTSKKDVIGQVVNYCFSGMDLRYDIYRGACHYVTGWAGGGFALDAYMNKDHPFCNCYDQAGAVQTFLSALGIPVDFHCIYPFGYLKKTDLVGRGRINNPFVFSGAEKKIQAGLLPTNDTKRSPFGEHGFCTWDNGEEKVVLDACAGPFVGNTSIQEYLESSIDGLTELYSRADGNMRPGRINDIRLCAGITDVHSMPYMPILPDDPKRKRDGLDNKIIDQDKKKGVVLNIPEIEKIIKKPLNKISAGTELINRFRAGYDTSSQEWSYNHNNQYLQVSISVSNNIQSARELFRMMAASSQLTGISPKKGVKKDYQEYLSWFTPYYKITRWWYYNLCIRMVGYNFPSYLFNSINTNLKDNICKINPQELSTAIPNFNNFKLKVSTTNAIVGSVVKLQLLPREVAKETDHYAMDFFFAGDGMTLISEASGHGVKNKKGDPQNNPYVDLGFKCTSPGFTGVGLVLVDRKTQLCSEPKWEMIYIT